MIPIIASKKPGFLAKAYSVFNHPVVIVGLITLVGAVLRLYRLGYKPLSLDEAVMYWITHSDNLKTVIAQNATLNSSPPLYAILLSLVSKLGETEIILRSISFVGGVAAIPAVYLLAKQFMELIPAYFTTLLAAVALIQITYSQYLREYSLTFLFATLILLLFGMQLNQPKWTTLVLLTLSMVIGITFQYGLALLILALNLVFVIELFFHKSDWKVRLAWWCASQGVVLSVVVAVYFLSLKQQMVVGFGGGGTFSYLANSYWNGAWQSLLKFTLTNTHNLLEFSYPGLAFIIVVVIGIFVAVGQKTYRTVCLLLLIPTGLTFIAALLRLYPYQGSRQDMFLVPMIFVIAGLGLSWLLHLPKLKWISPLVVVLLLVIGVPPAASYLNSPGVENIRPIVSTLEESYTSGDKIYVYYSAIPAFTYYYRENAEALVLGTSHRGEIDGYYREIDTILKSNKRVWLVFSHCYADECNLIPAHYASVYAVEAVAQEQNAWLYLIK